MKITSAYANKLLKSLTDEKSYWEAKEAISTDNKQTKPQG